MTIRVKLFARARDLAGMPEVVVVLPDAATVADLRRVLAQEHSALAGLLMRSAIAVADDFAVDTMRIPAGAEVALLPPVNGG